MRTARPNPEIPELLRLIETSTAELVEETDHTRRIGRARVLIAHLEMLCDEPEEIVEVTDADEAASMGQLSASHHDEPRPGVWLRPEEFDRQVPPFTGAYPFDEPGDRTECFVQFAGGALSPCYHPGPMDPWLTGPTHMGFVLHALEIVWVAETPTTRVIVDDGVVDREARRHGEGGFWIVIDPAGRGIGVGAVAGRYPTREKAVARAKKLAGEWGVRTGVAIPRITFHNR